eukprot:gene4108-4022_t
MKTQNTLNELNLDLLGRHFSAQLTLATPGLPHEISERLRVARLRALEERKPLLQTRLIKTQHINGNSTLTAPPDEGLNLWNILASALPLLLMVLTLGWVAIWGVLSRFHPQGQFWHDEAILAMVMLPLAFWLGQSWVEIALLAGSVLLVMIVELLNTCVESAIDRIGPEWHDLSKRAKDMGSAAVFLSLLLCAGVWLGALCYPSPVFSVCVYCGSKPGKQPEFAQIAVQVGTWIGAHGGQLVYGGGRNGLMGLMAEATLAAGGTVVGIIPTALVEKEWAHHGCTELHVVDTMHERKRLMADKADAFLALPGGIGTFEELFEVWTWRQLGYHDKPVGILNSLGYYDGLMAFIGQVVQEGFMGEWQTELVTLGTEPEALLQTLVQKAGFSPRAKVELI